MKYLSNRATVISLFSKELRQGNHMGQSFTEVGIQVPYSNGIGATPCHEGKTRRTTNRLLAIGLPKDSAVARKAVDIGCSCHLISVTPEHRSQIINRDKQHIGRALCAERERKRAGSKPKSNDKISHTLTGFYQKSILDS